MVKHRMEPMELMEQTMAFTCETTILIQKWNFKLYHFYNGQLAQDYLVID